MLIKKQNGKQPVYLLLYVDDMLISGQMSREIRKVKAQLKTEFDMKDLGVARRILGMDIIRTGKKGSCGCFRLIISTRP